METNDIESIVRLGRPSQPLIESAVRQNTFVWNQLHSEGIEVPIGDEILNSLPSSEGWKEGKKGGKVSFCFVSFLERSERFRSTLLTSCSSHLDCLVLFNRYFLVGI